MSRVYQGRDYIECVFNNDLIPFIKCQNNCNGIVEGELYSLQSPSFDGVEMEKKVYKILGIIGKYHGVDINSVIVKQVSGAESTIFEINRLMAKELGIQYEPKIFLLPYNLNWHHEETPLNIDNFNPNDLSTYPNQNGYINYIIVKLSGFNAYRNTHIITSSGRMLQKDHFLNTFHCYYSFDLDEDGPINIGGRAKIDIISDQIDDMTMENNNQAKTYSSRFGYLCDRNGNVWVRIDLVGKGVKSETLKDKNINDLFRFCWSEDDRITNTISNDTIPIPNFSGFLRSAINDLEHGLAHTAIKGLVRELNGRFEQYDGNRWVHISENSLRGKDYRRIYEDELKKLF